jgi:hypothetical protein
LNASLRFSAEQFLYDGEDVIDILSLYNSTTWNKDSWIKKYIPSFSDLFDITKIVDNDDKAHVMSTAWDKAEVELGKIYFDKMLGFRYHDDVGKVTESVSISAIFDKLLQKHVLLRAFQLSKDDDVRLKGNHLRIKQPRSIMYWSGGNQLHPLADIGDTTMFVTCYFASSRNRSLLLKRKFCLVIVLRI